MQQISGRDHDCMGTGLVFLLSAIHSIFDVAWRLQTKETGPKMARIVMHPEVEYPDLSKLRGPVAN
jgi:hypothetical protein